MPINPRFKALKFLDSSGPYRRLFKNPKTEASKELFLPKNDFKNSSTLNFCQKDIQIFETWKTIKDMKFRLKRYGTFPSIYELNITLHEKHISQVTEYHRKLKKAMLNVIFPSSINFFTEKRPYFSSPKNSKQELLSNQ